MRPEDSSIPKEAHAAFIPRMRFEEMSRKEKWSSGLAIFSRAAFTKCSNLDMIGISAGRSSTNLDICQRSNNKFARNNLHLDIETT